MQLAYSTRMKRSWANAAPSHASMGFKSLLAALLMVLTACGGDEVGARDSVGTEATGTGAGASGGAASNGTGGDGAGGGAVVGAGGSATGGAGAGGGPAPSSVLLEDFESGVSRWIIEGSAMLETDTARTHQGAGSLRVDFRDPNCGPSSCNVSGNNCFENLPQVVSRDTFDLVRYYVSWWVYYPSDFTFYQGPCLPTRGAGGHFVRFTNFRTPSSPNDSYYQAHVPDFGQENRGGSAIGQTAAWLWVENASATIAIGRNNIGDEVDVSTLAGSWNHYELWVDLGTADGADGELAWSIDDQVLFELRANAVNVGTVGTIWGTRAADAAATPGLLRTSASQGFTRLGLVSNPNSSFGGRPGDVYWIDDLEILDGCPAGRPVCGP